MHFLELLRSIFFFGGYLTGGKSFKKPLSQREERMYIDAWMGGDTDAREKLIEHNMRLVAHIAKKYSQNHVEMEDLISIGSIGLIKGVNTFRPEKSNQLAVYAARCIENEILMYLRADKKHMGTVSLDDPIGEDKEGNQILLMNVLGAGEDEVAEKVELHLQVSRLAKAFRQALTRREQIVIYKRYGLSGQAPLPQRELARELGISRSYVSRVEKKALQKLRQAMQNVPYQTE